MANYETNPILALWNLLPPEARRAYGSMARFAAELSPGAAFRDAKIESDAMVDAVKSGNWVDAAAGPAKMVTAMAGIVPIGKAAKMTSKTAQETLAPIRAYHGSPHSFDKFDLNKIGTGEGNQSFGHGLYFAEREGTARSYRDTLAGVDPRDEVTNIRQNLQAIVERGQSITPDMVQAEMRRSDTLRPLMHDFPLVRNITTYINGHQPGGTITDEAMRALRATDKILPPAPKGHMYEVNIHADPAQFLDWDKPLSAQGTPVQKALEQFGYKADRAGLNAYDDALLAALTDKGPATLPKQPPNPLGANIYESSKIVPGGYRDPVAASQALREAGIPGVRYLDGGSRAAGQGSHNYAMFDDKTIEILRKYGLLPATVAAGATGAATVPGLLAPPDDKGAY